MSDTEKKENHVAWAYAEMDASPQVVPDAQRILILMVARLADEVAALRDDGCYQNDYIRGDIRDLSTNVCHLLSKK